jgi:transposase
MLMICKTSKESLSKTTLSAAVGVNHNSIQKWRSAYISGGLEKLLEFNRGGFKPSLITADVHKKIEAKLTHPKEAFRSFEELRQWIDEHFIPGINYHTVNKYVKRKFGAKLKVARKSHVKKDEQQVEEFKKNSLPSLKKK